MYVYCTADYAYPGETGQTVFSIKHKPCFLGKVTLALEIRLAEIESSHDPLGMYMKLVGSICAMI